MLDAIFPKSREITKVYREGNSLYLAAEAGLLRLIPEKEGIVRISFTDKEKFTEGQSRHIMDLTEMRLANAGEDACSLAGVWNYEEMEKEICLYTKALRVYVNRRSGSVRFGKADGSVLLAEADRESRTLEEFDCYRIVMNESIRVEEVQTPDGIKRLVREADKEFAGKLYHTTLHLKFADGEKLYGLGQAEEGVWNLRGTTQYLHQANMKIAVPVLLSSKSWGIMLSTQSPVVFQDTAYGSYLHTEADEYLDYYFLTGETLKCVVRGIRELTGQAVMLPKWVFGYIQSQERYETAKELIETAQKFRERKLGLDCLVLDWMSWKGNLWGQKTFDETRFPNPSEMIKKLHEKQVHFMISIWPNMTRISDNYHEFSEKGCLLPASEVYDAFREEGRKLYWEQTDRGLFTHGVDAWWCDSSEPITPEWGRSYKPEPGEAYRDFMENAANCMPIEQANAYGLYHAKAIYEGQRGSTDAKRVTNLTRSGYLGSQKYGAILWSGDTCASWETLKKQIVAGLQFTATGLPYWTLDIGAFFVKEGTPWFWKGEYEKGNEDLGYRELYTRWFQYGAFLPVFRSHGTDCRREPWHFGKEGEPFYEALASAIRLRYRLLPYLYSLAGAVWREHDTIMRPLIFDFPTDEKASGVSDEYMMGPSLLVCPVTTPMYYLADSVPVENASYTRQVYLPAGSDWYDLRTNEKYAGGQEITAAADIMGIPVYVRAGAIVPMMEPGISTQDMEGKDICLKVYPGADGAFTLYEDAGDGYGYEKGEYCLTYITYSESNSEVSIVSEGDITWRKGELKTEIVSVA